MAAGDAMRKKFTYNEAQKFLSPVVKLELKDPSRATNIDNNNSNNNNQRTEEVETRKRQHVGITNNKTTQKDLERFVHVAISNSFSGPLSDILLQFDATDVQQRSTISFLASESIIFHD